MLNQDLWGLELEIDEYLNKNEQLSEETGVYVDHFVDIFRELRILGKIQVKLKDEVDNPALFIQDSIINSMNVMKQRTVAEISKIKDESQLDKAFFKIKIRFSLLK